MQEAFGIVIFAVVLVAVVVAVITLFGRSRAYEQIGRGGLSLRDETYRPEPTGAVGLRERDDEIRQMLAARNERRARRGEAPLDVEAELARLTAPAVDPALEDEVRSRRKSRASYASWALTKPAGRRRAPRSCRRRGTGGRRARRA